MEDRASGVSCELEQLVVGHCVGAGPVFARDERPHGIGGRKLARQADGRDERRAIVVGRQIARPHRGRFQRVRRLDAHRPA